MIKYLWTIVFVISILINIVVLLYTIRLHHQKEKNKNNSIVDSIRDTIDRYIEAYNIRELIDKLQNKDHVTAVLLNSVTNDILSDILDSDGYKLGILDYESIMSIIKREVSMSVNHEYDEMNVYNDNQISDVNYFDDNEREDISQYLSEYYNS
ncbi:MAG: hypothetical protein ACRCXT_03580 [Paraclostridium sp.]